MRNLVLILAIILSLIGVFFWTKKNTTTPTTFSQTNSSISQQSENPAKNVAVSQGETPTIPFKLPSGFTIHTFAKNLGTARDLQFSPGGALLVSNPSSSEIYALPDKKGVGVADEKKLVVKGPNKAHGLAFFNNKLYVAGVTQVVRYNWDENNLSATQDKVLFSLPENGDHNLRTITFSKDGKMFVSVGSTCNVCQESSEFSATVITADAEGNNLRVFAKGLRNAPFIQFNPKTLQLWGTEMGRDNLGDNLPPDEINIIKENLMTNSGVNDYGWPNCYGNKIHDTNFDHSGSDPCGNTVPPIYEIPAHSAPLGLTFIDSAQFPADWQGDLLVAYHGSWNRSTPTGYKVVHLKVNGNSITNSEDFITGFLPAGAIIGPAQALGRPVDLTFDQKGNLYLSDDKSGSIYIIQKP